MTPRPVLDGREAVADQDAFQVSSPLDELAGQALIPFDQSLDYRPLAAALAEAKALLPAANAPKIPADQPRLLNRHGRRQRGALGFVRETDHCRPIDRNDRARLLSIAEHLERRSKSKGKKNGALGYIGLRVLRALLLTYANLKTGLCCPSYTALMHATGLCRQAIADALHRLEATNLITITRRLLRERITRLSPITGLVETITQTVQGSNLYAFNVPAPDALIPLPWRTSRRRPKFAHAQAESTTATENNQTGQPPRKNWQGLAAALDTMAKNIGYKGFSMKGFAK